MKKICFILCCMILFEGEWLNAQCQLIKSGFSEVFVDEFNDLNYSLERWDFKPGEWCIPCDDPNTPGTVNECPCDDQNTPNIIETCSGHVFDPNQVEISSGMLRLKCNKISPGIPTSCGVKQFKTGMIESKVAYPSAAMAIPKQNKYTLFEARILWPQGSTGIYPAFWMFGGGGEIDIAEFHGTHFVPAFIPGCHRTWQVDPSFNTEWHTYAVAWRLRDGASQTYKTTFFLDGKELWTQDVTQSNLNKGYHVILSNFCWNWAILENDFNEMLVDYVRVYESSHENVEAFKAEYFNLLNNTNAACHSREYSMDVGEDNQVFFNNNGWMYNYYYQGGPNGQWHLGPLASWNQNEVINGDVKVGPGNIVYFRGQDAKLHKYEWIQPGSWQHSIIPFIENESISHKEGSIAVGFGNQSPKLACALSTGRILVYQNNTWVLVNLPIWFSSTGIFKGDLTISGKYIYYRGADDKLYCCYYNGGNWTTRLVTDAFLQNIIVRNQPGSIVSSRVDNEAEQCFVIDANGWVRTVYVTGPDIWGYGFCTTSFDPNEVASSGSNLIVINDSERRLYYKSPAGDLRFYHFTGSGINGWHPGVIAPCDNANISPISNNIRTGVRNQIFYRDQNGYIKNVFWRCCESLNDCGARSPIFRADDDKNQSSIQIIDNNTDDRFSIHPNPTSNYFYISDTNNEELHVTIYDSQGKFIYVNEKYSNDTPIAIKDYPSGLYYLKIISGQVSSVLKILKVQ